MIDVSSVDFTPAHTFTQKLTVAFPPDPVFAAFGRVEEVAACLPGAAVTAIPAPDRVEGVMRVGLGPIAASFRGAARIERDAASRSGRIVGGGQDRGSAAQGAVSYRVLDGPEPGTSRVEIEIGYTLRGPLAQFGRPGIVRDLAGRLTADFAGNLAARLGGREVAPAPRLGLLGLLAGWLRDALRTRLRRRRG